MEYEAGHSQVQSLEKLDEQPEQDETAQSEQEMDETLRSAAIPKETKTVLHKNLSEWDSKIAMMLEKDA